MDSALDLLPLLKYIQWYPEIGKPFLFGGQSLVVTPFGCNDYFLGPLGHRYHLEFDIFSPLPPQYSSHPGLYPPQYSTPPGPYPPLYSTPSSLDPPSYSTPLGPY
ncbi:hypothetical protein J1N35_005792 [Gossypium stocksii]|uniref:Uncharacterized protein n=1 Tax=Gossypium stocksii TaxID=47602 RepID=A0A9D3WFA0_9ROSI|nr:hypothetical protein J1N35_005792 [Gossypium stocksii]